MRKAPRLPVSACRRNRLTVHSVPLKPAPTIEMVWLSLMLKDESPIYEKRPNQWGVFRSHGNNYLADIKAIVVSSMRFEKPHSLSYHDETLTRLPDTLVSVESKVLEAGLWLKSLDTSGSTL